MQNETLQNSINALVIESIESEIKILSTNAANKEIVKRPYIEYPVIKRYNKEGKCVEMTFTVSRQEIPITGQQFSQLLQKKPIQ